MFYTFDHLGHNTRDKDFWEVLAVDVPDDLSKVGPLVSEVMQTSAGPVWWVRFADDLSENSCFMSNPQRPVAYAKAIALLREAGVKRLDDPDAFVKLQRYDDDMCLRQAAIRHMLSVIKDCTRSFTNSGSHFIWRLLDEAMPSGKKLHEPGNDGYERCRKATQEAADEIVKMLQEHFNA